MRRILITLEGEEFSALNRFAESERRTPNDHAAIIIRQFLERRGLVDRRTRVHMPPKPNTGGQRP